MIHRSAITACAVALLASPARADEASRCIKAAEDAQVQRDAGHLMSALDDLVICARDVCPIVVRQDCVAWLPQVEATLPSVLVHAVDARGADVVGVRVLIDGKLRRERLDGRGIPLDPGQHRVRFEVRGAPAVERAVLISETEKNRVLEVKFEAPLTTDGALEPPPPSHADVPSIVGWGLVGLGAAGLVVFGVVEAIAQGEYASLRDGCGATRACTDAELSPTRTKFDVAKVALVVGAASLAVGVPLLVFRGKSGATRAALDVAPVGVRLRGAF